MPFFAKFRSAKQSDSQPEKSNLFPKPEPYSHIPTHAARDARLQVPPSARESDREAIAEHHKRRSQMPQQYSPVLRVNTTGMVNKWSVSQRDVPYVSKEKQAHTEQRPTATLKELNQMNTQRKTSASRRAAYIEPTPDMSYNLGLLPSPLDLSVSDAESPDIPSIPLPNRTRPPMSQVGVNMQNRHHDQNNYPDEENNIDTPAVATRSNSSSRSSRSTTTRSRVSSTSSQEPLYPPPSRNRARDSLSCKDAQGPQSHSSNSSPGRGLRAAPHDSSGIKQAMASPDSFRPHRAPPAIVRNDSAYPLLSMAGFEFGTERPYSPDRLRPWLTSERHIGAQYMVSVNAI